MKQCHNKTLAALVEVFNIHWEIDLSLIIHYDKSYIGIFKYICIRGSEKVVEVQHSDLVAENIGDIANKTAKIIKKAVLGGGEACLVCRRNTHPMLPLRARFWEGGCGDGYGQHD